MKVSAPDGRMWKVGRRWFPRRRRLGRADLSDATPDWLDVGDLGDDLSGIVFAIVLAIVGFVLVLVLFNVVAIAIELVLLVLVLFGGLFARVVLRRPWIVQARCGDTALEWPAVGWLRSRRVIRDVASQLAAGSREPRPAETSGAQLDAPRLHR